MLNSLSETFDAAVLMQRRYYIPKLDLYATISSQAHRPSREIEKRLREVKLSGRFSKPPRCGARTDGDSLAEGNDE